MFKKPTTSDKGNKMDKMNKYNFITFDGVGYTLYGTPDQNEYFIEQYNQVRFYSLWINDEEWTAPRQPRQ